MALRSQEGRDVNHLYEISKESLRTCCPNAFEHAHIVNMIVVNELKLGYHYKREARRHIHGLRVFMEPGNTLGLPCLSHTSPLRRLCIFLSSHAYFNQFNYMMIMLFSFSLTINSDRVHCDHYTTATTELITQLTTLWFLIEVIVTVIAMGLYNNKNAYLKDYANVFDFFLINVILVESLLYFIENMDDTYHRSKETVKSNRLALTIARFGRLLRPLRLIRAPEMRDTLDSLIKSMPSLCNALLMNLMCLYVYSILGIQLFSGRMSYCSVKNYMSKDDCEAGKAKWKTNP